MFESITEMEKEAFNQSSQIEIKINILYTVYDIISSFIKIINYCIFILLIILIFINILPWYSMCIYIGTMLIELGIGKYFKTIIDSDHKKMKIISCNNILNNYKNIDNLEEWEYNKILNSLLIIAGLQLVDKNND